MGRECEHNKKTRKQSYLLSCQKEFVSNSGRTKVAFIILAASTALHIYMPQWVSC